MTLTMIQLAPDLARLTRWATKERLLPDNKPDLGYVLHAGLAAAFGAFAPKPFALVPGRATLLGYTAHPPSALRDHAASFASPEVHTLLGVASLAAKAMPERFAPGQRLGFAVRARPMVRTDKPGKRDATVEKDAFVLSPPGSDRGQVYAAWLERQLAAGGAAPGRVALDSFQLTWVCRRDSGRVLQRQNGPDVRFSGELAVADPELFAALLARGVGRHRAFGFGMLLLPPA